MGPAGTLNFDPTAGEAPPQAPAPTPTFTDFAMGANAPLPSAASDLRRSAFGDDGAANYDALIAAGSRRPMAGISGLAGVPVAPDPNVGLGGGTGGAPGDLMQLFGDVISGATGTAGQNRDRQNDRAILAQRQQAMELQRQTAIQQMGASDMKFLDDLKGIPLESRPDMVAEHFAQQGRAIPPSVARLVTSDAMLAELTSPENLARMDYDPNMAMRLAMAFKNGPEMVRFLRGLRADSAENERKISEASISRVNAAGALPLKILQIQEQLNKVGRMPTDPEKRTAHDAGQDWYRVDIPGMPGQKMWKAMTPAEAQGMAASTPGAPGAAGAPGGAPGEISAADFLGAPAPTAGAAPGAAPAPSAGAATPGAPAPAAPGGLTRIDPTRALGADQPRNIREQQIQATANANLLQKKRDGKITGEITPDMVWHEAARLRAREKATEAAAVGYQKLITEGQGQASRALALIGNMDSAVQRYGLSEDQLTANTVQPLRMLWDSIWNDPAYSVLTGFDATLSNIARGLGEKGVLTDPDVERVNLAIKPRANDTVASYNARIDFVREAIKRSNAALKKAQDDGTDPADTTSQGYVNQLDDITYPGEDERFVPQGAREITSTSAAGGQAPPTAAPVRPSQEIIGQTVP